MLDALRSYIYARPGLKRACKIERKIYRSDNSFFFLFIGFDLFFSKLFSSLDFRSVL